MLYFNKCSILVNFLARNPRSLSSFGGRLPLPGGMVFLFDGNSLGGGPKHVTTEVIPPCGFGLVFRFFPAAIDAVVVRPDWMETMRVTICPHILQLCHLWASALAISVLSPASAGVWVLVLLCVREFGNGISEGFDLRSHGIELVRFAHGIGGLLLCGAC